MKTRETTLASYLYLGVPAVSLFILTGSVTDPVNLTKLFVLGGVAFGVLAILLARFSTVLWHTERYVVLVVVLFLLAGLSAVAMSELPLAQNLYGVYGRNTGYLAYLFLAVLLVGSLVLRQRESFNRLYYGLFVTGLVNVLYCGWVIAFGDFIGWNNPYGNILGLFGNPNFIGAFLGIWISATTGFFLTTKLEIWQRVALFALILLAAYEVYSSRAVQGVVVTSAGLATVIFFYIRSKTKDNRVLIGYSVPVIGFGLLALAGALQKGPLAEIVYKVSVSLRGVYWRAGIEMGLANPLTGVGMDGYGDWYRPLRSEYAATTLPGPTVVTNSAHNIPIDIFAYGGFPLLVPYLILVIMGAKSIMLVMRRTRVYDSTFVALSVAWIGYQLQSLISINQIGLAVWGWVLTGTLIAYERLQRVSMADENPDSLGGKSKYKKSSTASVFSDNLVAGLGLVVGLIVAVPPLNADSSWVSASKSGSVQNVENALTPSYLRPISLQRLINSIQVFENSKLPDLARKYALIAVDYNPKNFEAWYVLYSISAATPEDKAKALQMMKELDPFNPEIQNL